ncbi:MAG: response regulator [Bdellovibrionota bacterium]
MSPFRRHNTVLLVEDNPADVDFVQVACEGGDPEVHLQVASDARQALAYLRREGDFHEAEPPALVLMDLKLAGKSGKTVLSEIRSSEELQTLPVVIFSSSDDSYDIDSSYRMGANAFVRKPIGLDEFVESVRSIFRFWLTSVELPLHHRRAVPKNG